MAIAECIEPVPPNIASYEAKTPEPSPSLNPTRFLTVGYAPQRARYGGHFMPLPGIKIAPPLPQLRMQGKWLQRAGFEIGTVVKVRVARGRLVVEADPVQNDERLHAPAPTVNVVHEPDTTPTSGHPPHKAE